jgi:hypothetical protein
MIFEKDSLEYNEITGDGIENEFNLSFSDRIKKAGDIIVFYNKKLINDNKYTINKSNTITFNTVPSDLEKFEVIYLK